MLTLSRQRCLNHDAREAVCRCPSCHSFFCRECVVLFEARLLCAQCLAAQSREDSEPPNRRVGFAAVLYRVLAFLLLWLIFYLAGWTILQFRQRAVTASLTPPNSHLAL